MLTLRPYQRDAIDAIYRYFVKSAGNPLIVLPTASGKSLVIAAFIDGVLKQWPEQRILILTHVRELIAQNHAEMLGQWPDAPAGIYSAGLGRREARARILFAGIQSVHNRAEEIGFCDLVLIDEAHLIPSSSATTYRRFLDAMLALNPKLKVIGFTATPYRLDCGFLHKGENALFTDIAFEVPVRDLIERNYLSPLVSKQPKTRLNVNGVGTRGGEFIPAELQRAVDQDTITKAAVKEILDYGKPRKSWLIFCTGVDHATHVKDELTGNGIACETVFGDTPKDQRDDIIADFKRGKIRALASMGVLTTGFNAPGVDLIAMLRPTQSTGLYVQMLGRGTRLAEGKKNCLVLDFAGNVARHGPIDLARPKKKGEATGEAPTKVCPECDSILPILLRCCPDCGHAFEEPQPKITATASTLAIISPRNSAWLRVTDVTYARHQKPGSKPTLRVDYFIGFIRHSEWICFEHAGFARTKAEQWWRRRARGIPVPETVDEALRLSKLLVRPTAIRTRQNGRYSEIVEHRFEPWKEDQSPASAPSAVARPAASAGSTQFTPHQTRVAIKPANGFVAAPVRPSVTGGKA